MAARLLSKVRFLALILPIYGAIAALQSGCRGGGGTVGDGCDDDDGYGSSNRYGYGDGCDDQ